MHEWSAQFSAQRKDIPGIRIPLLGYREACGSTSMRPRMLIIGTGEEIIEKKNSHIMVRSKNEKTKPTSVGTSMVCMWWESLVRFGYLVIHPCGGIHL